MSVWCLSFHHHQNTSKNQKESHKVHLSSIFQALGNLTKPGSRSVLGSKSMGRWQWTEWCPALLYTLCRTREDGCCPSCFIGGPPRLTLLGEWSPLLMIIAHFISIRRGIHVHVKRVSETLIFLSAYAVTSKKEIRAQKGDFKYLKGLLSKTASIPAFWEPYFFC